MSYHIYKTEGLIMGGFEKSESSRVLYIFTRELGLILAQVQSVRALRSKLRYSLQDFSHSRIDLVRGKGGWRIISARGHTNLANLLKTTDSLPAVSLLSRTIGLLRRLVKGEEQNERLFDDIMTTHGIIRGQSLDNNELLALEIIIVMRMLDALGYWGNDKRFTLFLTGDIMENKLLPAIKAVQPAALREINKALKETQL